jgi:hypothetical protein
MLIEPTRWKAYFAELSRQAEGYETTIEIMSSEIGDQIEVRQASLRELAVDPREGISIATGDTVRHVIGHPTRVEATDEPGVPSAVLFETEDGTKTLVRLAAPEPGG